MKKKNNYLNAFENADDHTAELLSERFLRLDEDKMNEMFEMSRKKYLNGTKNGNSDSSADYAEVKIRRKTNVTRYIAAAAALVLAAGAVTAGIRFLDGKNAQDTPYDSQIAVSDIPQAGNAPFGDVVYDDIRFISAAYVPYALEADEDTKAEIADAFCRTEWTEISEDDFQCPDGESHSVYVYNGGDPFSLVFYGNNYTEFRKGEEKKYYLSSGDAYSAVVKAADQPVENDQGFSDLVWIGMYWLKNDGIWDCKNVLPDETVTMFEDAPVPEEARLKEIRTGYPEYEYDYNETDIDGIAEVSDSIIIGTVESVSNSPVTSEDGGYARTMTRIKVIDSVRSGYLHEGDTADLISLGGYISLEDCVGSIILESTGGKYGEAEDKMSEEERQNIYYHEITGDGEVPVTGAVYAFFVMEHDGQYTVTGNQYGMLYRNGDEYVQKVGGEYRHFTFTELMELL